MANNRHPRRTSKQPHFTPKAAELLELARGRWQEILSDLGLPAEVLARRNGGPCPRCGGRDRFNVLPEFNQRGAVHCRHCFTRGCDPRPGDGLASIRWLMGWDATAARRWLAGWLGMAPVLSVDAIPRPVERRLSIPDPTRRGDRFGDLAERYRSLMRPGWLCRAADLLGIPPESLARLGVGWADEHRATTWPMRDASGNVIGVRLRCPRTARKWTVRGSSAGLFYAVELLDRAPCRRLCVAEGPTDTAALLSIGFDAVGVPSAGGGAVLLGRLCRSLAVDDVVIVADGDGPGREGAERLAKSLSSVAGVRIVSPPEGIKDARAWVCGGADQSVIDAAADASQVHRVAITRVVQ